MLLVALLVALSSAEASAQPTPADDSLDRLFDDELDDSEEDLFGDPPEGSEEDLFDDRPDDAGEDLTADGPEAAAGEDALIGLDESASQMPGSEDVPADDFELEPEGVAVPAPSSDVEEILVVGEVTGVEVAEVTDSAISFDSEEIVAKGFSDIADLAAYTPNLEIKTAFAGTNPTLFIRGVGLNDYLSNAQSSVAVYNDGVYMQSPTGQLFQLFDTEGIEVLRGPQGSVYGRNATAGAILVSARKPSGDFGGYSRTTYGRFRQFEQEGALEFPLVNDVLSARVAGRVNKREGITRNRCATPQVYDLSQPFPHPERTAFDACNESAINRIGNLEEDVNNVDNFAWRGLVRFETDISDWVLNVHGGKTKALATHFQKVGRTFNPLGNFRTDSQRYVDIDNLRSFDPTDGNPYAGDYNRTGNDIVNLFGSSLTGNVEFENWSLLSITALETNNRDAETDTDSGPNRAAGNVLAPGAEVEFKNESTQISQELRGVWAHPTAPLTITVGSLTLYEKLEVDNRFLTQYQPNPARIDGRSQQFDQTTVSWGVYSDLSWDPFETLTIAGGLRYNWDQKDFDLKSCSYTKPRPGPGVINCDGNRLVQGDDVERWTAVTGEATATYRPTESINFYLKYAHGWKPGQFNGSTFAAQFIAPELVGDPLIPPVLNPADPESVDSLELGFKTEFWDGRIALSGAGFIYRYDDLQVFRLRDAVGSPPVNELINAQDAQVAGVELEFEIEPIDGFFINGAAGWLYSAYNRFTQTRTRSLVGIPVATISETQDYSGNRLIASPEFTFTGTVRYEMELGRYGLLKPRLDFTWRSEIYFGPNEGKGFFEDAPETPGGPGAFLPKGTLGDDALPLLNLQLGYVTPSGTIELVGWARNVTDEEYKIDAFDVSRGLRGLLFVIGEPRTYGLSLTVNF